VPRVEGEERVLVVIIPVNTPERRKRQSAPRRRLSPPGGRFEGRLWCIASRRRLDLCSGLRAEGYGARMGMEDTTVLESAGRWGMLRWCGLRWERLRGVVWDGASWTTGELERSATEPQSHRATESSDGPGDAVDSVTFRHSSNIQHSSLYHLDGLLRLPHLYYLTCDYLYPSPPVP
jgi:hypothetical protein